MIDYNLKYHQEQGLEVVAYLKEHGFGDVQLIGSLSKVGFSDHDIDVYIPNCCTKEDRKKLIDIFQCEKVEETDWGGIYFTGTKFGDVDIYFSLEGFDY